MKLIFFLTTVGILQISASVYSQETKLNISFDRASIKEIMTEIENQSEMTFFYSGDVLDIEQTLSLSSRSMSIDDILHYVGEETGLSFTVIREHILVTKAKTPNQYGMLNQEFLIKGKVTDINNIPLPGVNVVEKGTTNGAVTDLDGNYSISVSSGSAILSFSFVGYLTEEIEVNSKTSIDMVLIEDIQELDEVVVIGYGTVKKIDLTGSVSSVSAKDIERVAATNPLLALQGRATGIDITTNSGMPGESASVLVRGTQSINGTNSPIYVVDGLITDGINNVNPNDIESVSILKDASATAIYGARAANGVIVVTTKRGTNTGKPEITFNSYVGVQTQSNLKLDLLNADEFLEIYTESYENAGIAPTWTEEDLQYYEGVNTNWMDEVIQTGIMQNYNLGLAGSSEKSNYYISGNYSDHKGMVIESEYEKFSLRFNSDHQVRKGIRFGNSLMVYASELDGSSDPYELATRKVPLTRVYDDNGDYGKIFSTALEHMHQNPVWLAKESVNNEKYKGVKGNIYMSVNLLEGLTFTARGNVEWKYRYGTEFTPGINPNWNWEGNNINNITKSSSQTRHWITDFLLDYSKTIADIHNFKFLAGYSIEEFGVETLEGTRQDTPNNGIQFLSSGNPDTQLNDNEYYDWAFISYFGRLNYNLNNKYLLTANIRRDGTSRLSEGNRHGVFPSASVAWRISEESFMNNIGILDDLKIRASWGTVGNVQSISYYGTISALSQRNYIFNNAAYPGYTLATAVNSDLRWETTEKTNIGIDAGLFNNQLYTNIDVFIENTKDLLFRDPIAYSTGLSGSPFINAGKVRNTGMEILLGYRQKINNDWSFDVSANATHVNNEVVDLEGRDFSTSGIIEGHPVNSYYGYQSNGLIYTQNVLDENPHQSGKDIGDIWIKDINGRDEDGNLTGTPDGEINSADRGIIGNRYPDLVYGLMGTANYKQWTFQLQLQGLHGVDKAIYAGEYNNAFHYFTHWAMNHEASILDRYHPTKNPNGTMPKVSTADSGHNFDFSDFWLEDASYLRIKNVNLNYSFNQSFCEKLNVNSLGAYVSVQNLYTFTSFPGTEVDTNADPYTGVPQPTTWTVGFKVSF